MYKIMIDDDMVGRKDKIAHVSEEGARIIWAAYQAKYPNGQTMERRNEKGGIAWLSEIESWKREGYLPEDFDWKKYLITK